MLKFRFSLSVTVLFSTMNSLAQVNLVPNYSFEYYDTCPSTSTQIYHAIPWFQPLQVWGSSDYFNECENTGSVSVPYNGFGFQPAKSGVAYSGIIMFYPVFYREFIEIKLSDSLIKDKKYCVSFYVSLANGSNTAINTMGCLFTPDSFLLDSNNQEILLIPHVENTDSIITDTMNWVLISGEFIANGGEQFLTIGNFRNDSNTNFVQVQGSGVFAYYYIDDVSVTLCDTTSIDEFKNEEFKLNIYPNPAIGMVTITSNGDALSLSKGGDEIVISDITGRKIKTIQHFQNTVNLSTEEIAPGIYYISLYRKGNLLATEKLFIAD